MSFDQKDSSVDRGLEEADMSALDDTTIQNFTADLLNKNNADTSDLADYLQALHEGDIDGSLTADDIIAYFEDPFGLADPVRTENTTLRFVPDGLGEGTRWDNELNWSIEDKPIDGDSIYLAGNHVQYDGTIKLDDLDFGDGGELYVSQGKLTVLDKVFTDGDGGTLEISEAGQAWIDEYEDQDGLTVEVEGGRFANTGSVTGKIDIIASGGQTLLGVDDAELTLRAGSSLTLDGSDAKVGFDGEDGGVSILDVDGGTLSFVADHNGFSTIEEFISGTLLGDTDVCSAANLSKGNLTIDVSGLGADQYEIEHALIDVDEIIGAFNRIDVFGLGKSQDAIIIFDYDADRVSLRISSSGDASGETRIVQTGLESGVMENTEIFEGLGRPILSCFLEQDTQQIYAKSSSEEFVFAMETETLEVIEPDLSIGLTGGNEYVPLDLVGESAEYVDANLEFSGYAEFEF